MKIIDGKLIALELEKGLKEKVKKLEQKPCLCVVLVGQDAASLVYVKNKIAACERTGIVSRAYYLEGTASEKEVLELIDTLNNDKTVHGILVQLPLPKNIGEREVLARIDPEKDVDGFSALQAGRAFLGEEALLPCTPKGCVELIKSTKEGIEGKKAVVVGRSNIVGKPLANLLLKENATVTICHSKTKDLKKEAKAADILVAAIGKAKFITKDMVKKGAIVIDVGINRVEGKLVGDVDFDAVKTVAGYITPVPGGVGPMTIAMLLENVYLAAKNHERIFSITNM